MSSSLLGDAVKAPTKTKRTAKTRAKQQAEKTESEVAQAAADAQAAEAQEAMEAELERASPSMTAQAEAEEVKQQKQYEASVAKAEALRLESIEDGNVDFQAGWVTLDSWSDSTCVYEVFCPGKNEVTGTALRWYSPENPSFIQHKFIPRAQPTIRKGHVVFDPMPYIETSVIA